MLAQAASVLKVAMTPIKRSFFFIIYSLIPVARYRFHMRYNMADSQL
jgi:hypothetical protein